MNEARSSRPAIDCDAAAALMDPLTDLVIRAGAAIVAINRVAMKIDGKADGSPVTEADLAADRIIGEGLARLFPEIPALSEERVDPAKPPYRGSFFLIDPLDGTKEFVAGRDEFTVNLALVTSATPLLGIIGAPALGLIWRGLVGRGAERLTIAEGSVRDVEPIHTRPFPRGGAPWIAAVSRSHGDTRTEAFIEARPGAIRQALGSAVKFGRVAEGGADIRSHQSGGRHRHRRWWQDHGCQRQGLAFWRAARRLYRAGIHRLGRSRGGALIRYWASCCSNAGQRELASLWKRSGSAAKASRLSSRPNR